MAYLSTLEALFEQIRDERRTHTNTAERVGNALLAILPYLGEYIRKDKADFTEYLLTLLAGAVIGESGQIRLNPDGSITCGRLVVEGSAIFDELVFNHQNVLEGDTYFTDKGIIEIVINKGGGQYQLVMRKEHENDTITFHVYDVLKCAVNNLDVARTYKTSWMLVDSVDLETNSMIVTMYDGEDVPGGVNYPPSPAAKMIRWGNPVDEDRQQVWFISSEDGRFLFLQGVTQPILTDGNYSAFFGVPPTLSILQNLPVNARQPYLFARGLIVQDIIKLDYRGNPQYTARDLGRWDATHQYIRGYDSTAKAYYVDRVWWGGCLWQAAVALPTPGREPRFNNADWACLLGSENMTMEITSTAGDGFPAGARWQTTLVAAVYNAEMLLTEEEIGLLHIHWERVSTDTGGDTAWNIRHAAGTDGLQLAIDSQTDFPSNMAGGSTVGFRCVATLPNMSEPISADYSILM